MSSLDQYPQRDGLYRILPEGIAVHNRYQDRIIMLDALSSELWLRADGKTQLREIGLDIAGMSGVPSEAIMRTLSMLAVILNSEGILYSLDNPATLPYHLTLPQEEQDIEQMWESMAAAGWLDE
jgi:hypothetical protein